MTGHPNQPDPPFPVSPEATGRLCRSERVHAASVPAVCVGAFHAADLGNDPEPDSAYCLRCAVMLSECSTWFTVTDGTELPALDEYLRLRGEHSASPHT